MAEEINHKRRRFLGTAAMAVAAAQLDRVVSTKPQSDKTQPTNQHLVQPRENASFGALKQIDAGLLSVGYAEAGPANGPRSYFCTAGPMTFTALSKPRHCWRRRGIE